MLQVNHEHDLLAAAWEQLEQKTILPQDMEDFFERLGLVPQRASSRRAYQRFFIRAKAIVRWQGMSLGAYSADASRGGLRFLSPIELPLKERVSIRLPNTKEFKIEIVRCERIADACFDCGAMFVLGI